MDVEKRLEQLAGSFAEQVSKEEVDAFKAKVYARLGLLPPSKIAESAGAAGATQAGGPMFADDGFPNNCPDVDYDEWVGQVLRRGNRWWVAPPRALLPNMNEEPPAPWVFLGEIEIAD